MCWDLISLASSIPWRIETAHFFNKHQIHLLVPKYLWARHWNGNFCSLSLSDNTRSNSAFNVRICLQNNKLHWQKIKVSLFWKMNSHFRKYVHKSTSLLQTPFIIVPRGTVSFLKFIAKQTQLWNTSHLTRRNPGHSNNLAGSNFLSRSIQEGSYFVFFPNYNHTASTYLFFFDRVVCLAPPTAPCIWWKVWGHRL